MAVFNGAQYLQKAVDSVLGQTLRDLQLICIDDASTDSTPSILAEYAAADKRVRIITHLANTGQAAARNDGIRIADGDYITMVDADDWLSQNALELAVGRLDSDSRLGAVLFDLRYVRGNCTELYPMKTGKRIWSGREAFELSLDWSVHGLYVARAGLYRCYPFDTACRLYSDDNTTRLHYLHSEMVGCCDGIYYYRQHASSMTNTDSFLRYDLLEANSSMARMLRRENLPDKVLARFERERWINLTGICIYWIEHDRRDSEGPVNEIIRARLENVYNDVDRRLLPLFLKMKPGYMPLGSFKKYLSAVELYNKVRKMLNRFR